MMKSFDELIKEIIKFRDDREWSQFHNSKDLAIALSIEASELLELFLWHKNEEFDKEKFNDELADVFMYALMIAQKNNINISNIIEAKIKKNALKYPLEKAKGSNKKYTELDNDGL